MVVLVTYDVSTLDSSGKRRLRRVAKICLDYGQRVQNSVFELDLDHALWVQCRQKLIDEIDPESDSLRFYRLGNHWREKVEHIGTKPSTDLSGGTLIA
ncbi:CRISPR-associated endonuclease Cas2 [Rhodopirellula sallentina]|jgi:CRISPR-associated protein Cas2|uniref:CRISPR-associated endoribonuclease Cas2 n=1 Tax=Rhodopirellula sallentina SM41 TaxID=1263870 RepID=M5U837_9BACT|nr:CRISPR-associated endonuclease Cas2 [Rhodopirellula sallentina]EMI57439.1 CRISPR-associated Cas2 family protein [Rhodopirellula sallentina SM41]